jgi:hypothetical protein
VLHQASAFHDRYLSHTVANLYTHLVTTDWTTIALTSFATFDDFSINLWSTQCWAATGTRFPSTAATTLLIA